MSTGKTIKYKFIYAGTVNDITIESHNNRHRPNGVDALPTAQPVTVLGSTVTNATGVANSFARSDHVHAIDMSTFNIDAFGASAPLRVSKGGTGVSTHGAGKFLTGDGTNAVVSTKTVPAGDVLGTTDAQVVLNKTITDQTNTVLAYLRAGGLTVVDKINGNDTVAGAGRLPFQTISAAVAAAPAGSTVWVLPGVYAESITVPTGVSIRGHNALNTVIGYTTSVTSTAVTLTANNRIEDVTISISSSAAGVTLTGVLYQDAAAATSKLRTVNVVVTNTTTAAATVYGVRFQGTGVPSQIESDTIRACTLSVFAETATSGVCRAVLVDGPSSVFSRDVTLVARGTGAIAVETTHASAVWQLRYGSVRGTSQDWKQTLGSIQLTSVDLTTGTAYNAALNQVVLGTTTLNAPAAAATVVTMPQFTSTLSTLAGVETLSNKTLTAPVMTGTATAANITMSGSLSVAGDVLSTQDGRRGTYIGTTSGGLRTATNQTALGFATLSSYMGTSTVANNTAGGYNALVALQNGLDNTAWGRSAGATLTTGSQMTMVGSGADAAAVSSVNGIALGFGSIAPSNTAVLGNTAVTEVRNSGNGTCSLGSATNKWAATHTTAARLYGANSVNYVQHTAPTLTAAYSLTWPVNTGQATNVLGTDGTGVLSWVPGQGQYAEWINTTPQQVSATLPSGAQLLMGQTTDTFQGLTGTGSTWTASRPMRVIVSCTILLTAFSNMDCVHRMWIQRSGSTVQYGRSSRFSSNTSESVGITSSTALRLSAGETFYIMYGKELAGTATLHQTGPTSTTVAELL